MAAIIIKEAGFDPNDPEMAATIRQRCMMAMYRFVDRGQVFAGAQGQGTGCGGWLSIEKWIAHRLERETSPTRYISHERLSDSSRRISFPQRNQKMPETPAVIRDLSKGEAIEALLAAFESAKHIDEDGVEFWLARELSPLLGYKRWENFGTAIGRAQIACANVGEEISDHFREVTNMIEVGKGAKREHKDYELTRFAAYLIALNGDPAKEEIAAAQTYFAVQTRRQELTDIAEAQPALTEDERRVLIRDEMKEHNKSLAS
ncbi:MAG: BRO family protein, partial [Rhodomicrobium sp.]